VGRRPLSLPNPFRCGFYKEMVTGPPGFEPGFEAPEAPVISKLYYGPFRNCQNLYKRVVLTSGHGP